MEIKKGVIKAKKCGACVMQDVAHERRNRKHYKQLCLTY